MALMLRFREEIMPIFDSELTYVVPEWKELKESQEGFINVHTLGVLYCAINDPEFAKLSPSEQNVIRWSCLLHDIKKDSVPKI